MTDQTMTDQTMTSPSDAPDSAAVPDTAEAV